MKRMVVKSGLPSADELNLRAKIVWAVDAHRERVAANSYLTDEQRAALLIQGERGVIERVTAEHNETVRRMREAEGRRHSAEKRGAQLKKIFTRVLEAGLEYAPAKVIKNTLRLRQSCSQIRRLVAAGKDAHETPDAHQHD